MKVKHMNNIYNNPFETEQQGRQRLERERWQNNMQPTTTTPTQPDYSKMSLREELSDRMDRTGFRQKEWTLSTPLGNFTYLDDSDDDTPEANPNRLPEQFTGSANQDITNSENGYPTLRNDKRNWFNTNVEQFVKATPKTFLGDTPVGQAVGAARDLGENYINMINANLSSSDEMKNTGTTIDNYYHCKGNYNAAQRGQWGVKTANLIGNVRENFDYYKNLFRGISRTEALQDKRNDLSVNQDGINMAQSGQYDSAEEACNKYRPDNYNDENRKKWYYYR